MLTHMCPGIHKATELETVRRGVFKEIMAREPTGDLVSVAIKKGVIMTPIPPPDAEELNLPGCHPYDVCGGCGKETAGGAPLSTCSGCQARKYCSRQCQKNHWQKHRIVCSRSAEVMAAMKACLAGPDVSVEVVQHMFDFMKVR
jgi:hypothetical protein